MILDTIDKTTNLIPKRMYKVHSFALTDGINYYIKLLHLCTIWKHYLEEILSDESQPPDFKLWGRGGGGVLV